MPGNVGKFQAGRKNKMANIHKNFSASVWRMSQCKPRAEQD